MTISAIVPYTKSSEPCKQSSQTDESSQLYEIIRESFSSQLSDSKFLRPFPFHAYVLAGEFPEPQNGKGLPKPFAGTREDLLKTIKDTFYSISNSMDFNGLESFLSIGRYLGRGKTFREIILAPEKDKSSNGCIGRSHALLKVIKEKHDIDGTIAFRRTSTKSFDHAAVIIECNDGYVLLDSSEPLFPIVISIPFNAKQCYTCENISYSVTSSGPGSKIPLKYSQVSILSPAKSSEFEFCTDIANGEDLVSKNYFSKISSPSRFIPILFWRLNPKEQFFNPHKTAAKVMMIFLNNQPSLILRNMKPKKGEKETQAIVFKNMEAKSLFDKLKSFMKPKKYNFKISSQHQETFFKTLPLSITRQIFQIASNAEKFSQILWETNLDTKL